MKRSFFLVCILITLFVNMTFAQSNRFLQSVDYTMMLDFDIRKHQYEGIQKLKYTNNSSDTLDRIFYHLFFNAFKPGSEMDVLSCNIKDPDPRVGDRIKNLRKSEQGFMNVLSLKKDGKAVKFSTEETILEVSLSEPILPGQTAFLEMEFLAQIPLQVRRTGRNNMEGIEYSVSQGYPKICAYDEQGWHANPYIAREFYGPFGNFDVTIELPSEYIVAATGILQNPEEIGYGYSNKEPKKKGKNLRWQFKAENVHDFVWAADPDYKHTSHIAKDGTILRFFYQENEKTKENWENLPRIMDEILQFLNQNYGQYPYPQYCIIQGGDRGMEYPMATLVTGERNFNSLLGTCIHEIVHSWFQGVIATNESLYPWMDEGFTNFVGNEVRNHLKKMQLITGLAVDNPHLTQVRGYENFAKAGLEEPMITHADHYLTNTAYAMAAYTKGVVFLEQLRYIIGTELFYKGMKRYYEEWKFKHPNPNDFIRVMEKVSGMELDWFKEYFVHTTHTIDYGIVRYGYQSIVLEKVGIMPMPLDITVTMKDGTVTNHYIPMNLMRANKKNDDFFTNYTLQKRWPWVEKFYTLPLGVETMDIKSIVIDPSGRLADIDKSNNTFPRIGVDVEDLTR
ncbi:MAG: M1 family metallopeptidase [Saprospiraceae bacterium]